MTTDAELASITTALDELIVRLGGIALAAASVDDSKDAELFEIERLLIAAQRRLHKLTT